MNKNDQPKVGRTFEHARFVNPDRTPQVFRVTRTTRYAVYYRAVNGAGAFFQTREKFPEIVKRWLD